MPSRTVRGRVRQYALRKNLEVKKELRKTTQKAGRELRAWFNGVVSDWKHKPTFIYRHEVKPEAITVVIVAIGVNAKIWLWVDKGTRPHVIRAKRAKYLRFQTGYNPRTSYRATTGGTGKATGDWRQKKEVRHPGTEAREFTEVIYEEYTPKFKKDIEKAFQRALRRR